MLYGKILDIELIMKSPEKFRLDGQRSIQRQLKDCHCDYKGRDCSSSTEDVISFIFLGEILEFLCRTNTSIISSVLDMFLAITVIATKFVIEAH